MPGFATGPRRVAVGLAATVVFFGVALGAIALSRRSELVAPFWPTNAMALVFILRCTRTRAEAAMLLAGVFVAASAADLLGGSPPWAALSLSALNVIEIVAAVLLTRAFATTTFRTVLEGWRFLFVAGVIPCAIGATGVFVLGAVTARPDAALASLTWAAADLLGFMLIGPFGMTVSRRALANLDLRRRWVEATGVFGLLALVTAAVFAQSVLPLLFVVAPFILLATFRFRLIGANLAILIVAAVAVPMTEVGTGPIALIHLSSFGLKLMTLQAFFAVSGLSAVPLAAALAQRDILIRRSRRREEELVEAAKIAELAYEVAGSGHWALALATGETTWSNGMFAIFGLPVAATPPSPDEVIARYAASDRALVADSLDAAIQQQTPLEFDATVVRPDGSHRRVRMLSRIHRAEGSERLVGVLRDVTDQYEADLALAQALSQANAANLAKSDFLANMSHEIRTPLQSIVGFSGLLADGMELTPEHRRQARLVHSASRSLVQIVDDILDVSKFEAEGVALTPEPCDLEGLIRDVVELVVDAAARKGVAVESRILVRPGAVLIDPLRVRQVLLNLLSNAIKFTPRGSVTLTLSKAGGDTLKVAVRDSGVGIAPDRLRGVFERFAQADASTSRRYGGTGLGLAICRDIVDSMGGEIGVESVEGRGSTFWFTVTPERVSRVGEIEAVPVADAPLAGLRVLLADDNEVNRELFGALMAGQGLDIAYAIDGADAVRAVREQPFDLVLMDVQMPVMDGLAAARVIREAGFADLPIIALTANVMPSQVATCREAGMDDHLGKPYAAGAVAAMIARWTGGRAQDPAVVASPVVGPALETLRASLGAAKLQTFLGKLATQLEGMLPLLASADTPGERLAQQAHAVRGFAGTLGFVAVAEAYDDLEQVCRSGADLHPARLRAQEATHVALDAVAARAAA